MLQLQHNVVSLLYTIQGRAEAHLTLVEERRFLEERDRLRHAEEVLKVVQTQALRALAIVKRIGSELKDNQATKTSARPPVSLKTSWEGVLRLLEKEFSMSGVKTLTRIPEGFPPLCCGQDEFKEILYHLAKNALEAMKGRGKMVLRAQLGYSTQEEPLAMMTLADTGPGIPEGELANLFQPFFTTKPASEGNGLGLYLTKVLVTKNHGRIAVSSFQGFGTTFTLEFPVLVKKKQTLQ